jgi:hypothetical protein
LSAKSGFEIARAILSSRGLCSPFSLSYLDAWGISFFMRQYRPTIEQLKKRYSAEMARRKMLEKWRAAHPPGTPAVQTPDNSEPWLPHLPRSLEECLWISDQVGRNIDSWKQTFPKTFSSAG